MSPSRNDIARARTELRRGDSLEDAAAIRTLVRRWERLRPERRNADEPFPLVDPRGRERRGRRGEALVAPRWLCHLLGLRHASAHVVLVTPQGLVVLQKRSREKDTAPGRLDTSVGGHVGAGRDALEAARAEMREELGLRAGDLAGPLEPLGEPFFTLDRGRETQDAEVVTAFLGRLAKGALDRIRFEDGEVVRLVLAPPDEVWGLLGRPRALAAGARAVLPRALVRLES